ncbi:Cysteine dioxygenase [Bulinus truncatus]|nr:Cysteine dioxygenase [Bulinus truncatus]
MENDKCDVLQKNELFTLFENINQQYSNGTRNTAQIEKLIQSYRSNRSDWEKYAYTNPNESYSRNLVLEEPDKYNALILCWKPGKGSKIHAHENSDCFLKILNGSLREELFHWPSKDGGPMKLKQDTIYEVDELNHMTDEKGLHRVTNISDNEIAVSLHIYMPPFKQCTWFVEETGQANRAEMTFASIGGKPTGEFNTLAEYCTERPQQRVCRG